MGIDRPSSPASTRRSPSIHRSKSAPSSTIAIDRHLLAGADPQPVADGDQVDRDFLVATVRQEPAGSLGRQIEQGADRT
jgi:hypothetical protein